MLTKIGRNWNVMLSVSDSTMVPAILCGNDMTGVFTDRIASHVAEQFKLETLSVPVDIERVDEQIVWRNMYWCSSGSCK